MTLFRLALPLCSLVLILFTGCESPGRALAKSAVGQIRDGQTTRAEVDKIFGEPRQMTKSPAGKTLYAYHRFYGPSSTGGPFADESHLLVLTVLFSPSDVVEKHLFSHTRPNVSTRMGRAGREFTTEELGRIMPQKTTQGELAAWFGPHWSEELTLAGERLVVWLFADAFYATGRVETQALEVLINDSGVVTSFRVTNRQK
jgi:hypothetical protein